MMGVERGSGQASLDDYMRIDLEATRREIVEFVRREVDRSGKDGVLVGFSGGLDSTTVGFLCKEALGAGRVYGLILPERDSSRRNIDDAEKIVRLLGIKYEKIDITPLLEDIGAYDAVKGIDIRSRAAAEGMLETVKKTGREHLPFAESRGTMYTYGRGKRPMSREELETANRVIASSLAKVRARMIELYFHATLKNLLLAGTTDLSEWRIGFYDKYGDAACDITLLKHLYKTQIRALARHIGVPDYIVDKPSSGDLFGDGLPNEALIGMPYETLDRILYGVDNDLPDDAIAEAAGVPADTVGIVKKAIEANEVHESMPFAPGQ